MRPDNCPSTCCRSPFRRSGTCSPVSFLPLHRCAPCYWLGLSGDDGIRQPPGLFTFDPSKNATVVLNIDLRPVLENRKTILFYKSKVYIR